MDNNTNRQTTNVELKMKKFDNYFFYFYYDKYSFLYKVVEMTINIKLKTK